jgi:hypothetical protein
LLNGIGKDTYKTAAECKSTYFTPLSTSDSYNGKFVQIAEPPQYSSQANAKVKKPVIDLANLEFIGVETGLKRINKSYIIKRGWQDIVDSYLLSDASAQAAFNGANPGRPILVKRVDKEFSDYYLVPFSKSNKQGISLVSAVIILDSKDGHFKEASWTQTPERFLNINKRHAIQLTERYVSNDLWKNKQGARKYRVYCQLLRYINNANALLIWQPNSYSSSPYRPYWKINSNGYIWYVTQEGLVTCETPLKEIIKEIEANKICLDKFLGRQR